MTTPASPHPTPLAQPAPEPPTPLSPQRDRPWLAGLAAAGGMLCLSLLDALIKLLDDAVPPLQLIFVRSVFATIGLGAFLIMTGRLRYLRTRRPGLHLLRALVGIATMIAIIVALRHMPLANAYVIFHASPFIIAMLSISVLGERVRAQHWMAIAIGFAGVVISVWPDLRAKGTEVLIVALALGGALGHAVSMVLIRLKSRTESNSAIVLFNMMLTGALVAVPMLWIWEPPSPRDWLFLLGIGGLTLVGHLLLSQALRLAAAAMVAPFEYTALIWGVLLGLALFGDVPGLSVAMGGAIVIGSGLFILQQRAKLDKG